MYLNMYLIIYGGPHFFNNLQIIVPFGAKNLQTAKFFCIFALGNTNAMKSVPVTTDLYLLTF